MLTLLNNWKLIVTGVLFLLIGLYASLQHERARELQLSLEACQSQRALYESNLKQLQYLSIEQDKKIDLAEAEIEKINKDYGNKIEALRGAKVPVKCSDAVKWVKQNRGSITWSK